MQENQSFFLQSVPSPTVGQLSPTLGAMEIHILRAAELLCTMCNGRRPPSELADEGFTVPGNNNYPSVRVWPGFEARRIAVLGDKCFDVFCCGRESSVGRIYSARALVKCTSHKCFTVDGETNLSLPVDSARFWSGFQARRVVVDGEMTEYPLLLGERKLRMQHGQVALQNCMHDAVQTPSASISLAASKTGRVHVRCGANTFG